MSTAITRDAAPDKPHSKGLGQILHVLAGSGGALIGLIVLVVALALLTPDFASVRNTMNIVDQVTVLGVCAVGATAIIITGGIDLSVGSLIGLSTMVLGWVSHNGGMPLPLAILVAIAVAALCGLLNGLAISYAKLPPFIATLAMMSVARGLANLITGGNQIVGYSDWFDNLASQRYASVLSVNTVVLVLVALGGWVILRYRRSGRSVYAIGGNEEVARLSGINVNRVTIAVYVIAAALAGVAGCIMATRLDSSQPSAGTSYELDVIAACVIGGASLTGGKGTVTGTIIGVFIIGVLRNGLNLLGVSPFIQSIVIGLVIAGAVMVDTLKHRKPE